MRLPVICHSRASRLPMVAGVALLIFASANLAEGKTRHRRQSSAFTVALEPFKLVHSAVHAVAVPIVHEASRVAVRAVAAPINATVLAVRALPVPSSKAEPVEDQIDYAQPIRVAYIVPRAQPAPGPREEAADESESANEAPTSAFQPEARGDRPMISGSLAVLRNGIAYAPSHAPQSVKNAIWAVNALRNKPYTWGGGHGSFNDSGYDCSGTVSFAMHHAGALGSPIASSEFTRFGERGRGRWITVYARNGHTFATIAGLRLDTTDFRNGGDEGPRWHIDMRDLRGFEARHPAGM